MTVTHEIGTPPQPLPRWTRLLDALSLLLFFLIVYAVLFGGFRVFIFGTTIRATGLGRLAVELVAVVALRHVLMPRPSLPGRFWHWIISFRLDEWRARHPTLTAVTPAWVTTRLAVLIVGYFAVVMIGYPGGAPGWHISDSQLGNLPARWDTGWYLGIATHGYTWNPNETRQQNLNFFPAFPMAMRVAAMFSRNVIVLAWAGVALSIFAFLGALVYLRRLMLSFADGEAADAAVILIASYPFAVFFSAAYSESLYLLAAVGAFYHLACRQPLPAAGWALVVGLSRPNGSFLTIPLAAMVLGDAWKRRDLAQPGAAWKQRVSRDRVAALAAAGMPIVGMLLFSFRAYLLTGQPFIWATLQQKAWGRTFRGLDETLLMPVVDMLNVGALQYTARQPVNTLHMVVALFAITAIWPVFRRFGLPFALMIAVNTFGALFAGGLTSMGRFTSVLFPIFMWLGVAVPRRHVPAWVAAFATGQALVAALFFTYRPLF